MNKSKGLPAPGRRIVTGVNSSGKSVIIKDGSVPDNARQTGEDFGNAGDLWLVSRVPADLTERSDPLIGYTLKQWPARGEVIARMITWLPGF